MCSSDLRCRYERATQRSRRRQTRAGPCEVHAASMQRACALTALPPPPVQPSSGDMAGGVYPSFLSSCNDGSTCATKRGGTLEVLSSPDAMHGEHVLQFISGGDDDYAFHTGDSRSHLFTSGLAAGDVVRFRVQCRATGASGCSPAAIS